jgi:hypothetical protein
MTQQEAEALFRYEPETGKLFWKVPGPKRNLFKEAGHESTSGYRRIMLRGKMYLAHRIVWLLHYRQLPAMLDHKDRNCRNNKIENLRESDFSENGLNSKIRSDNRHNTTGVSYEPRTGKFYARFQRKHLGTFNSIEEAHAAYQRARTNHRSSQNNQG